MDAKKPMPEWRWNNGRNSLQLSLPEATIRITEIKPVGYPPAFRYEITAHCGNTYLHGFRRTRNDAKATALALAKEINIADA